MALAYPRAEASRTDGRRRALAWTSRSCMPNANRICCHALAAAFCFVGSWPERRPMGRLPPGTFGPRATAFILVPSLGELPSRKAPRASHSELGSLIPKPDDRSCVTRDGLQGPSLGHCRRSRSQACMSRSDETGHAAAWLHVMSAGKYRSSSRELAELARQSLAYDRLRSWVPNGLSMIYRQ